ncbi:MAG TPA: biotin/lipoyl-binding protein [Candidatus Coprousia avicola]|nr:biotin/lipoyl-binding protein [Candidatus Coprousia avicola]
MLRKFKISIDGTAYLVEMEEVGATATPADAVAAPAAPAAPAPAPAPAAPAPAPAPAPAAAPAASAGVPSGAHVQTAPMPGKIVDVKVNVGDTVKVNQPVLILEAMKMESEIVAEQDGVVASINVAKGDMVNPGDTLFSLS